MKNHIISVIKLSNDFFLELSVQKIKNTLNGAHCEGKRRTNLKKKLKKDFSKFCIYILLFHTTT